MTQTLTLSRTQVESSRSGKDDVVDRDEDKLDEVADHSHDEETHDAGLQDLHVLSPVWLLALLIKDDRVLDEVLNLGGHGGVLILLAGHLSLS